MKINIKIGDTLEALEISNWTRFLEYGPSTSSFPSSQFSSSLSSLITRSPAPKYSFQFKVGNKSSELQLKGHEYYVLLKLAKKTAWIGSWLGFNFSSFFWSTSTLWLCKLVRPKKNGDSPTEYYWTISFFLSDSLSFFMLVILHLLLHPWLVDVLMRWPCKGLLIAMGMKG